MVQLIEPREGMAIYDPCAGSGGMLIQSKQYVRESGGDPRNLSLAGQELNGGTWSICKMNLLLHGIRSADIRQGDTIREPQHMDKNGEIRRFDRVIANPPFSQNYARKDMKFPERFSVFMPESGKKADLMFVQHMAASLKSDGKLAVVMPHGVLFRGGEERTCRKKFIDGGVLEAVIGLPPSLFYGTGIPAAVLVLNKDGAGQRDRVLFINADREYREGKNQNSLRPEDIEKISYVCLNHLAVDGYAREVPYADLAAEDYNLNIRRYVDNSPPPEPHDVRAHLNGGVPVAEIEALSGYFANYHSVRKRLFAPKADGYNRFSPEIETRDDIKPLIESAPSVREKHDRFHAALDRWWTAHVPEIETLPETRNVFELRRRFLSSIAEALVPEGIMDLYQVRGAFAAYMNRLAPDFKSVSASGWGPELIPEEDILHSQFPEVLEKMEADAARIAELEGLFAAADVEDAEPDEETGVLPSETVKALKDEKKAWDAAWKDRLKELKMAIGDLFTVLKGDEGVPRGRKKGEFTEGLTQKTADFDVADRIMELAEGDGRYGEFVGRVRESRDAGKAARARSDEIAGRLAAHSELDRELKTLKAEIKQAEKNKDDLVAEARRKIGEDEAKTLILERFRGILAEQYDGYLRQYQRGFVAAIENLWDKYAVTLKDILAERDREAAELDRFMVALGYE